MNKFPNKATQFSSENQPEKRGRPKGSRNVATVLKELLSTQDTGMGGDGDFVDNNGNTYKITSGSIGIYPLGDDVSDFKMEIYEDIGCIHTMDKSFSCTYNESKGVVKFGTITINTKSS